MDALGSSTGALLFYGLGHWLGEERVRRFIDRRGRWFSISAADFDSAKFWFERYGEPVVFFGHMVPMVRSLISIPAGLAGMNLARFTLHRPGHSALEPAVGLGGPHLGAELAPGPCLDRALRAPDHSGRRDRRGHLYRPAMFVPPCDLQ